MSKEKDLNEAVAMPLWLQQEQWLLDHELSDHLDSRSQIGEVEYLKRRDITLSKIGDYFCAVKIWARHHGLSEPTMSVAEGAS